MKKLLMIVMVLFTGLTLSAGQEMKIRLIKAYNSKNPVISHSLKDVAKLLRKNLPYNSFELVDQSSKSSPISSSFSMGEYQLGIKGDKGKYFVKVDRDRKSVFKSNITLKAKSPVIVGGFSTKNGKHLFIFSVK